MKNLMANSPPSPAYVIVDLGMRMLTPRELFRAQGFGDNYFIDRTWVVDPNTGDLQEIRLTKEQQIRMCGNSVCPQVLAAISRLNTPELSAWHQGERTRRRPRTGNTGIRASAERGHLCEFD